MTTLLTIVTILAIIFGGLWRLAEKNYGYLNNNFNKILYFLLSFSIIPALREFIIVFFKIISKKRIETECHLKNMKMFNELSIDDNIHLTLLIVSISSCFFLIFLLRIFKPNYKK